LSSLHERISAYPDLSSRLTFTDLDRFVRVCRHFKAEIQLNMKADRSCPPSRLPLYLHNFIRNVLGFDDMTMFQCWVALRDLVWLDGPSNLLHDEIASVHRHGDTMFYPPTFDCTRCSSPLRDVSRFPAVYYSRDSGARAAYSTSLHCKSCKIRYYHNYFVEDQVRCYYGDLPAVIHFEEHAFVEARLCELFTLLMLFAWCAASLVSGQNCSNIFNSALAEAPNCQPPLWPQTFALSSEQVWRAFFLNSLLRDSHERRQCLSMPDTGSHEARIRFAMEA
ncbi:hypothetical protein FA95DRAFT_1452946, partial [Auriscalpium vulgare]